MVLFVLEAMWIGRGYTCDYVGRAYAMIHGMLRVICVGATVIEFTEVMRLADVFCTSMNNQGMWGGLACIFHLLVLYAKLYILDGSLFLFLRVGWSGGGGRERLCVRYQAFLRVPMRVA